MKAYLLWIVALAAGSLAAAASPPIGAEAAATAAGVQLLLIEGVREFPEATEVGAIRFACGPDENVLRAFFAEVGAPFRESLVRKRSGFRACHIYYEPTIPGFRALPDDRPITGLVSGIDPASLVGGRKAIGDSLDVAKQVLSQIDRPLDVTFSLTRDFDRSYWAQGMERAFPDSIHRFSLIQSEAQNTHPWGQDFVKAGQVNGEIRVLTPRRLFEGRGEDGDLFRPLLEAMKDGPYVRSKLSWEGGDLQLVADPQDASRIILFHGGSASEYWGSQLESEESSYVLQVELGADSAVDLAVGPHTDYIVGFLPAEGTVLVAEPVRDDIELALAAAQELLQIYGERSPGDLQVVASLLRQYVVPTSDQAGLEMVRGRVQKLLVDLPAIESVIPVELQQRLDAHHARHCPEDPTQCYVGEGKRVMLRADPALLEAVYNAAADNQLEPVIAEQFLRLIESQLPNFPDSMSDRIEAFVRKVRKLGFRVIRVPYLYSPEMIEEWPGVSYTNSLLFDKTLFVPAVGLGRYEEQLFRNLQKKLPKGYRVAPIEARFGLMNNGGVHCVFGILREPGEMPGVSSEGGR